MTDAPRIRKLDASVVNRIAAGEIIVQPANALKEMLENSIDAQATMVDVLAKDGGLKMLQITDNGSGIARSDLPVLCERFTTSKLKTFDDLSLIATYGFRGEALASISHISRLIVVLKMALEPLAYKAYYLNGTLASPKFKTDGNTEPKPVAGRDGTQITVEDLFYNLAARLRAMRSGAEEWARILDVLGRYAVHTEGVGFSCKKQGDSTPALAVRPQASLKERIRTVFGTSVASELIEFEFPGTEYGVTKIKGAVSGFNYNNKRKAPPVFFINNRLVSCDPLKRALMSVFQLFLPKGNHPFIYMSLDIVPQNLDVNVHPTKREVRFLFEDEIIQWVCGHVHDVLSTKDGSRNFKQSTLKKRTDPAVVDQVSPVKKYRQEHKLVRVDATQLKLNAFMNRVEDEKAPETAFVEQDEVEEDANQANQTFDSQANLTYTITDRAPRDVKLDSIQELREAVREQINKPLTNVFNNLVYVGIVDASKRLCCFQYDVKLFLCDYGAVLNEFYYQCALTGFANYGEYVLETPLPLRELLAPLSLNSALLSAGNVIQVIFGMKDMLLEYFLIKFEGEALTTLPMIVKDVAPSTQKLAYFIYRMATAVEYQEEKQCLQDVMKQLALLYIPDKIVDDSAGRETRELSLQLENVIFPAVRKHFIAPESLLLEVVQVADLPGLYRVFERC